LAKYWGDLAVFTRLAITPPKPICHYKSRVTMYHCTIDYTVRPTTVAAAVSAAPASLQSTHLILNDLYLYTTRRLREHK